MGKFTRPLAAGLLGGAVFFVVMTLLVVLHPGKKNDPLLIGAVAYVFVLIGITEAFARAFPKESTSTVQKVWLALAAGLGAAALFFAVMTLASLFPATEIDPFMIKTVTLVVVAPIGLFLAIRSFFRE